MRCLRFGVIFLLSFALAGRGDEVSPPSGRKSTFRVYDQRPIYVPGAWEQPADSTRNSDAEFLPGADRLRIQPGERQFGNSFIPTVNLLPLAQTAPVAETEDKDKKSSWLTPGDFLLERDLLQKEGSEMAKEEEEARDKKASPSDWSVLQKDLIEKELAPGKEQKNTEAQPTPQPATPSNPAPDSGLTLPPLVSETPPGSTRQTAPAQTASGLPPSRSQDLSLATPGRMPSVLRMDGVQPVALPQVEDLRAMERSRAEFEAVSSRWRGPESVPGGMESPSRRADFGGGGRSLFAPAPALQQVAMPNPLPSSLPPPSFSPPPVPPPAPALDREFFRPDEYRIRPRGGSPSFP